ncbi:MAG TPA: bifunctional DNA primase/polymerase, partial [Microbacterium sp.]|nr:bifunctional DNA primase/polymerase [Microbacterium sp.]
MQDDTGYPDEGWPKSEAARWYAAQGWRVLPLHTPYLKTVWLPDTQTWHCSCQHGADCRDMGKHPRTMNGVKAATADAEVVAGWWEVWPDANIGIATGRPFAFVVDEDTAGALLTGWGAELQESAGPVASLPGAETPNGTHYLFDASDDFGSSTGGR